jgi:hypothetical protein
MPWNDKFKLRRDYYGQLHTERDRHSDKLREQARFEEHNARRHSGQQSRNHMMVAPSGHGPEIKSFDTSIAEYSLPVNTFSGTAPNVFTGGMTCLNLIQQGATYYNRIGSKATIKSIAFAAVFDIATPQTQSISIRIMIVYDRQCNGAYPTTDDILSINDGGMGGFFNVNLNMANRSRFMILRDGLYKLDQACQLGICYKTFIKCRLDSEYSTNTGAIGDIRSGAIYLIAFSDSGTIGGTVNQIDMISGLSRIRYYD